MTLGVSDQLEVDEFLTFTNDYVRQNKRDLCAEWVSFDTESIHVPESALKSYKYKQELFRRGKPQSDVNTFRLRAKGKGVKLPTKILYGDGVRWLASIRLPWEPVYDESGAECFDIRGRPCIRMKIIKLTPDDPILMMLRRLGCFVGSGVTEDCEKLYNFFDEVWAVKLVLPRQVELAALYVCIGGHFMKPGIAFLNFLCAGGIMNKIVSEGDNSWYLPLRVLPDELVLYCLDDVRAGHLIGCVFFSIFVRQYFADPSVACFMLTVNQEQWVNYIMNTVIHGLNGVEVHRPSYLNLCVGRQEQLLNYRTCWGADRNQPTKLDQFKNLVITPFATLPYGGPRVLHQVRVIFKEKQYPLLMELATPNVVNIRPVTNASDGAEYISDVVTFGRRLLGDQLRVQPPCFTPGLVPVPMALHTINSLFRAVSVKGGEECFRPDWLISFAAQHRIEVTISQLVAELFNLYSCLVPRFVVWISEQDLDLPELEWWHQRSNLFERIRLCYFRMTALPAPDAPNMRDILNAKVIKAITNELNAADDPRREARIALAFQHGVDGDLINLHRRLYQSVPGTKTVWNYRLRQNKKRAKSEKCKSAQAGTSTVFSRLGNRAGKKPFP